jgi:hypothetical protein
MTVGAHAPAEGVCTMIRSFRSLLFVSAAALVASCGVGAPAYPEFGAAAYRLEGTAVGADGVAPVQTVIYRDGAKMRVETVMPTGRASIVRDDLSGAAYIVTASTPVVVTPAAPTPAPAAGAPLPAATPSATTTTTATTTTVAPTAVATGTGTAVRIADADVPKPMEEAWVTLGAANARNVGACNVAGEKGNAWTPKETAEGVSRVACITQDGIVLEIKEGERVLWQATSVQRGAQDAALFGVPAGYQIIDPQAVAEAVGDTMQEIGQVAGDPKTPPTATPAPTPAPAPKT